VKREAPWLCRAAAESVCAKGRSAVIPRKTSVDSVSLWSVVARDGNKKGFKPHWIRVDRQHVTVTFPFLSLLFLPCCFLPFFISAFCASPSISLFLSSSNGKNHHSS
jgi:hypothetical protein